jgi:hypothetical protein
MRQHATRPGTLIRRAGMLTAVLAALLVPGVVTAVAPAAAAAPATATINVDGGSPGPVFQGIGGLSAGASSRLLIDYPEPQRSQILDYLFTPHYGASLQVLKVEIGSGTDSTAGSEPSHEAAPGVVNCNSGYEWWLMEQARKRNPGIKLWGLQWGAPGWVGGSVYTPADIDYLLSWLGCARQHHLTIDMLGGWNERSTSASVRAPWYEQLRSRLDAAGYRQTGLLIGDEDGNGSWASAADLTADPALRATVIALGDHYPCRGTPKGTTCASGNNVSTGGAPSVAQSLGLPLWASEMGSDNYITGANGLARAYNRQYLDGRITGAVNWSLAACWYSDVTSYAGDGLLSCETPWSGNYAVDRSLWATAQTTQFAAPGWRYDDAASGYAPMTGGSYVTLKSPDGSQFSTIIETTQATAPQDITLSGLGTSTAHVWSTDLGSPDPGTWFTEQAPLSPSGGAATITLQPDHVYTITNTTGQHKGDAAPPPPAAMQLPYRENFNGYPDGATPRYFSDQEGTWETAPCRHATDPAHAGKCLQQTVTAKPVRWRPEPLNPLTVTGDPGWDGNYTVAADALLDSAGTDAEMTGRVQGFDLLGTGLAGYHLRLDSDGQWSLFKETTGNKGGNHVDTTLAAGTVATGADPWHHLALTFAGSTVTALIDGSQVASVTDGSYSNGQVGLATGGYDDVQFDNLTVTP